MEDTRLGLEAGIKAAVPGARVGDIGAAVQAYGESRGYGVVREFVGHGVGRFLHEDPQVPNYGEPGRGRPASPRNVHRHRADVQYGRLAHQGDG